MNTMKHFKLLLLSLFVLAATNSYSQEVLDIEKLKDCELFKEKDKFDKNERLAAISELEGKFVTVYLIKEKTNKIKSKYTGVMDNAWAINSQLSDENRANVVTVRVKGASGETRSYYPHTNKKYFRIYLADCAGIDS